MRERLGLETRLERELEPLFGDQPRRVVFSGYVQTLRKPERVRA